MEIYQENIRIKSELQGLKYVYAYYPMKIT
jgi:hypothetical protein